MSFGLRALGLLAQSALVWSLCTAVFLRGETDEAYLRIASPAQSSLILGTSRAAQGIYPQSFARCASFHDGEIFNFAFTSATSPWGPAYLQAIESKLIPDPNDKPGLFILEVSPIAFAAKGEEGLRESNAFLARLHSVTISPNIEYPFYQADRGVDIIEGLLQLARGAVRKRLHPNGWLEITLNEGKSSFADRLARKLAQNKASFEATRDSPIRWEYLGRTVERLRERGNVALVRLPMHPEMLAQENVYHPDFGKRVTALARALDIPYVDLTDLNGSTMTTDGSHIAKASAPQVTSELVDRLPRSWCNAE